MKSKIAIASLLVFATTILTGCEHRASILSAKSLRVGNEEEVQITIRASDAQKIKSRQLYFYLIVSECNGKSGLLAADPYIGGQRAVEFGFKTLGERIDVMGRVPGKAFDGYVDPCVSLEGGGYLTGTLRSNAVSITRARALTTQSRGPPWKH